MAKTNQFSIILPTYSGLRTLSKTYESILAQNSSTLKYELIVIIDGPSKPLRQITEDYQKVFENKKISFTIKQFEKNQGRFAARVAGARLAAHDRLLFLEDRVYLSPDYFKNLANLNYDVVLGNILEDKHESNFIADTLTLVRQAVYGNKWGQDFKDYDINAANFERAPKGMASLWIERQLFLDTCDSFEKSQLVGHDTSDDTGVLRLIIEGGRAIRRISKLKLYYIPRSGLSESTRHLYQRGPKFVDYYLRPGTRFFYLLVAFYAMLVAVIALAVLAPIYLWVILGIYLLAVLILALRVVKKIYDFLLIALGLPIVATIFFLGVLKGTINKLGKNKS